MNRQTRTRNQQHNSQAYRSGYSDYLNSDAVNVYGQFNISPTMSARETWASQYPLYVMGWEAAKRS